MDSYFAELGRAIYARWQARNFSLAEFPETACAELHARRPAEKVDVPALIERFLLEDEQPFQTASPFGQPELVVFDDPRFYIQILFWLDGTTDIHQHKFSGAFHVLQGSSIHSRFVFEDAQSVTANLRVGQLRMVDTKLLETGSTEPIVSGRDYIHSLFHLDTPSLTVVVRTHSDPGTGPQFNYLPPHLAVDPYHHDALTNRRKQLLDVLEKMDDESYPDLVAKMLQTLDFERGFYILQHASSYLANIGMWDDIWEVFERKHGALAGFVMPTLEDIVRRDRIVGFRSTIADVEHRFFLALLLNVPTRADIIRLVENRYPGKAQATILRWAEELGDASMDGSSILDAEFPDDVDLPKEEQAHALLAVFQHDLEQRGDGRDLTNIGLTAEDIKSLRTALERSALRALVS